MNGTKHHGEELFSRHFHQIEQIVHRTASQHRLSADEAQELYSRTMLKVVEDDYAVLRAFQKKSSWRTYLVVIIQRVLLDYRVERWGRWRPSARARRLGATAIELDRRINRDGLTAAEAISDLQSRGVGKSDAELERLAAAIPRRPGRRFLSGERHLEDFPDRERADRRLDDDERRRTAALLNEELGTALGQLSGVERNLLALRFGHGWTVRRVAEGEKLEVRGLYRRYGWILGRLRRRLEGVGLSWTDAAAALDRHDVDLGLR